MARLPLPGSDDGVWGTVLNNYLGQAHKADGTLKDAVVTADILAPAAGGNGEVLTYDTAATGKIKWSALPPMPTSVTMGGDVTGSSDNAQIASNAVGTNEIADLSITPAKLSYSGGAPTAGQVLTYDSGAQKFVWTSTVASDDIKNQYAAAQVADYWVSGKAKIEDQTVLGGKTNQTQLAVKASSDQTSGNPLIVLRDSNDNESARIDAHHNSIFFGYASGLATTGNSNVGIGNVTLQDNIAGAYNVAFGDSALQKNTIATGNVAIGFTAMQNNTSGSSNVAVGNNALRLNTTSNGLVAVGNFALSSNQSGAGNTAVGNDSLSANTDGSSNTSLGATSLSDNTTGDCNTSVGNSSLARNTTGGSNTAIGFMAGNADTQGVFLTQPTLQASTAIGTSAQVTQDYSLVLGSVDIATQAGVGITSPQNFFSASPVHLNSPTITATQSGSTITSSAAIFSAENVAQTLVWADDGSIATITAYTDSTHVTVSTSVTKATGAYFRTHRPGLQVATNGSVGVATATPNATYALDVNGAVNATSLLVNGAPVTTSANTGYAAVNAQTGTSYTPVLADAGKLVMLTNAAGITVTLPSDTNLTLAIGSQIDFAVLGAGKATFVAGSGATANATPSLVTRARYSTVSAIKYAANSWLVVGDLA